MTKFPDTDTGNNNVVPFPRVRRMPRADWAHQGGAQTVADTSLNVRLTILLGICMTGASLVLTAIHAISS